MESVNYQGYKKHAPLMSKRIRMRRSHPELSIIDDILISFIKKKLSEKKEITLLDAGCGTGERLKMIFERGGFSPTKIKASGVDFCEPLIDEAKLKIINNKPLFTSLMVCDLENIHLRQEFDIIVCLFSVLNNVGSNYQKAITSVSRYLKEGGYILFDFIHPEAAPRLFGKDCKRIVDIYGPLKPHEYYYERQLDHSEGKVFIFSLQDMIISKKKKMFLLNTPIILQEVYDINTYRTNRGKFAVSREYIFTEERILPNS